MPTSARKFGSQALIGAIDIADEAGTMVTVESGKRTQSFGLLEAVEQLQSKGIGEILLQSVSRDGVRQGMDLESIRKASRVATVPIIASSGAGSYDHLEAALSAGAEAVAAGAMFQFSELTPAGAREHLRRSGYDVRR
jgi:cyclase